MTKLLIISIICILLCFALLYYYASYKFSLFNLLAYNKLVERITYIENISLCEDKEKNDLYFSVHYTNGTSEKFYQEDLFKEYKESN